MPRKAICTGVCTSLPQNNDSVDCRLCHCLAHHGKPSLIQRNKFANDRKSKILVDGGGDGMDYCVKVAANKGKTWVIPPTS